MSTNDYNRLQSNSIYFGCYCTKHLHSHQSIALYPLRVDRFLKTALCFILKFVLPVVKKMPQRLATLWQKT